MLMQTTALLSNVIEIMNLELSLKKKTILENITLSVEAGTVLGLFGHNGAGKSTLLKTMLGLYKPDKGLVRLLGKYLNTHTQASILPQIGVIIEKPALYEHLSGKDNLHIVRYLYRQSASRVLEVAEEFRLNAFIDKKVKQYSMGMKQRLALAMSVLHRPSLVIWDEPTSNLDEQAKEEIHQWMHQQATLQGTTFVWVSHDLQALGKYASKIAVLKKGKLAYYADTKEFRERVEAQYRLLLHIDSTEQESLLTYLRSLDYHAYPQDASHIEVILPQQSEAALLLKNIVPHFTVYESYFTDLLLDHSLMDTL